MEGNSVPLLHFVSTNGWLSFVPPSAIKFLLCHMQFVSVLLLVLFCRCTLRDGSGTEDNPMRKNILAFLVGSALLLGLAGRIDSRQMENKWESSIRKFEKEDQTDPPKPGEIVFTGSSSIRYWDTLAEEMKPLKVINRGFGGSEMSDLDLYAKRIVVAYHPRAVVVYEGDNDLAKGSPKTPESVALDFQNFVNTVHEELPDAWIYVLSIKPSKLRWDEWPRMKAANQLIEEFATTQKRVQYIDVATPMFDAHGNLPADLFKPDGLHPTAKLYAMWTAIIKPVLLQRFGPGKKAAFRPGGQYMGNAAVSWAGPASL